MYFVPSYLHGHTVVKDLCDPCRSSSTISLLVVSSERVARAKLSSKHWKGGKPPETCYCCPVGAQH